MYKLNIKRLNDDLSDMSKFYEDKPNLSGDAGLDLHFPTQTLVQEKETVLIPLGISAEMVQYDIAKENLVLPSYQNLIPKSFFIVPRSSITKHHLEWLTLSEL